MIQPISRTINPMLDQVWQKAAVAGGLWASVEIIVGSFLHNIRIPFAGGILASFGVMLMVAFYRMWPERGLIWRAGLVCALMKSISPSAVIFGPMIGIMAEAIVLDFSIRLFGRRLAIVMVAGALAVSTALGQKIFNILIIYGMNLVKVYLNLFEYASRQMGFQDANPWLLILAMLIVYFSLGLTAALIGNIIGKRTILQQYDSTFSPVILDEGKSLFNEKSRPYSIALLVMNLIAIPAGIIFLNHSSFLMAGFVVTGYMVFGLVYYPNLWRRISKPVLWIQLLIVVLLSGLFYEKFDASGSYFSLKGVQVGLEMCLRAMLIITAFTGISIELRNPLVRMFLMKRGLQQVYNAVSMAFRALPSMLEAAKSPSEFLRRPVSSVAQMLSKAREWQSTFNNQQNEG